MGGVAAFVTVHHHDVLTRLEHPTQRGNVDITAFLALPRPVASAALTVACIWTLLRFN